MGKFGGIQALESDSVYANLFLYPLQGHKRFFLKNSFENNFYFVISLCLE